MGLRADVFEEDHIDLVLIEFNLNLSTNLLTLIFSETVDVSTLNVTAYFIRKHLCWNV